MFFRRFSLVGLDWMLNFGSAMAAAVTICFFLAGKCSGEDLAGGREWG